MVELWTHCESAVAPTVAETVYSGQGVHAVEPGAGAYESPGHCAHTPLAAPAAVPATHVVHDAESSGAAVPGGQGLLHVAEDVALVALETYPPGQ